MKRLLARSATMMATLAAATILSASPKASAQVLIDSGTGTTASASKQTSSALGVGGDVRAPSPGTQDPNRKSFAQIGVGPGYGIGFASDSLMYNIMASYNWNYDEHFTWKAIGDVYMASGTVSSRMLNIGGGLDIYVPEMDTDYGTPYFSGDISLSSTRNAIEQAAVGAAVGAGTGFKFRAQEMNFDVNLHYTLLTAQLGNTNPSTFGLRVALNF